MVCVPSRLPRRPRLTRMAKVFKQHENLQEELIHNDTGSLLKILLHRLPVIVDPAPGEFVFGAFGDIRMGKIETRAFRNGGKFKGHA